MLFPANARTSKTKNKTFDGYLKNLRNRFESEDTIERKRNLRAKWGTIRGG